MWQNMFFGLRKGEIIPNPLDQLSTFFPKYRLFAVAMNLLARIVHLILAFLIDGYYANTTEHGKLLLNLSCQVSNYASRESEANVCAC